MRELGTGHFGTVYLGVGEVPGRGRQPGRRRLVAIKRLKDAATPTALDNLVQEFALLDQVKHRGIVRVFEYIEDENAVVMEYIHGVTLRKVLDELEAAHEQVFTEAAVEIGCEIADALYQAWTTPGDNGEPLQLVHRDLKPENVMLTPSGEVKILDWGLARVDNAEFRGRGAAGMVGSLLYMSPEQASMHEVDHRSDVYGLGLVLFELLMGHPAYQIPSVGGDEGVRRVREAVQAGDTQAGCRELESRLNAVGPIITRALRARPDDRYQDGQAMLVDLRRQLYRDRGAYLGEFCEFFFGSIHTLDDPPSPETSAAGGRRSGRSRNPSLEERVRRSMDREDQGSAAAQALAGVRSGPRTSAARDSASRTAGNTGGPSPGRVPVDAGGDMAGGNGGGPKRPPVGGGASRSTPFSAPKPGGTSGGKRTLRNVGQRRPDETGMLEMVPLSLDNDEAEAAGDPSATAFFAIPAPKAERARPQPGRGGPPPPPGIGAGLGTGAPPPPGVVHPSPMGAPPPPSSRPPMGQPPPAAVRGPVAAPGAPPSAGGIQGPVAARRGASAVGGPSPFQVGPPAGGAATPGDEQQRVKSQVVWVVLFGAMVFIGAAALLAVYLMRSGDGVGDEVAADAGSRRAAAVGDSKPRTKTDPTLDGAADAGTDTGIPRPKKPKKKKKRRVRSGSGTASSATAAAPRPRAASGPATLTVRLPGIQASSVEVVCPTARKRAAVTGESATIPGVPQEECTLFLKGGAPGKYGPVHGGQSLSCSMSGVTLRCR
ncbi:MAG: protein kinase [Myxococcota bacterium]|nr:protein kinase [Myxococcota bacterium]